METKAKGKTEEKALNHLKKELEKRDDFKKA